MTGAHPFLVVSTLLAAAGMVGCGEELPSSSRWRDGTGAIRGEPPLGYVTNNGDDTVSIVELATLTELARVPVGLVPVHLEGPHHLTLDPAHGFAYVGISNLVTNGGSGPHGNHGNGTADGYAQRFTLPDFAEAGAVRVDSNLGEIVVSPDGALLLTTHFDMRRALDAVTNDLPPEQGWAHVVVVDAPSMTRKAVVEICTAPHGAAITGDGSTALVACYGDDRVAFVDLTVDPPVVVTRVPVGGEARDMVPPRYGPYSIVPLPDGQHALVGSLDGQDVRLLDVAARAMVDGWVVRTGGASFFGALDDEAARYFVPTQGRDGLAVLDVATHELLASRTFTSAECIAPHEATFRGDLGRVLLVCEGDHRAPGKLVAIDPDDLSIVGSLELGIYPDALRVVDAVSW